MTARPLVLTLGDPAGIGPEIALTAWTQLRGEVPFVLLGDRDFLRNMASARGLPLAEMAVADASDGAALSFVHHELAASPVAGSPDIRNAASVVAAIVRAVRHVQDGAFSAIVTNPVSKLVLKQGAGFNFPGHTEFLAHLGGGQTLPVMMLAGPDLRVVPVTVHIPVAEIAAALTVGLLESTIRTTWSCLRGQFGIREPRLAVAGLNPHAGEGGTMGREENETISPVLDKLRREGMHISGPHSADTMFHPAARSKYDAAICMYHDQALIPLKTLDFDRGVNVTLGLPFIRTSPDHGTAFDIAGKNLARADSLIAALRLAWDLVQAHP